RTGQPSQPIGRPANNRGGTAPRPAGPRARSASPPVRAPMARQTWPPAAPPRYPAPGLGADVVAFHEVRRHVGHTDEVNQAVVAPDGKRMLTASNDGTIRSWDLATGREIRRFAGAEIGVGKSVSFHLFRPDSFTPCAAGDHRTRSTSASSRSSGDSRVA